MLSRFGKDRPRFLSPMTMQSSFCCALWQVQRMICLILSFQIGSHLLGLKLLNSLVTSGSSSFPSRANILVKNNAMRGQHQASYQEDNTQLLSGIRLLEKIQGLILYPYKLQYPVSSIQSSFSRISIDLNLNRSGLPAMLNTNLYTLGFGLTSCRLIKLSLKRICDPRFNMIRALF